MPCNSDYLQADVREIALSQVACLLEELEDKKKIDPNHWRGYHPAVYCKRPDGDKMVDRLCAKLQKIDVSKCSLEMQIWWRDHQEADRKRLKEELEATNNKQAKEAAIAKLTPHERRLLGL